VSLRPAFTELVALRSCSLLWAMMPLFPLPVARAGQPALDFAPKAAVYLRSQWAI